ncbi:MAG: hypothetical protein WAX04_14225 [Oscillospiraceae bacterium]
MCLYKETAKEATLALLGEFSSQMTSELCNAIIKMEHNDNENKLNFKEEVIN